jgi:Putative prokaryotic signal transducing protein
MTGHTRSTRDNDFVKVAHVNDQAEAELLQGLLRTADVGSVVRRAPGFDVPEFLAAGPREVLVAASDVPVARDVLREVDPGERGPPSRSGADPRSRVLAGVLIAVALVALVVCLATDVLA